MITWDDTGSRKFEAGVDRGVFYPKTGPGVPWNGLVSVNESVDSSNQSIIYIDGIKLVNQIDIGTFSATIEAFTYPSEFEPYDGLQFPIFKNQLRSQFNFSYRTLIGNDLQGLNFGYRLHLVYNCMVKPTSRNNESLNSDIQNFSWDLTTIPEAFPYDRPTAHIYLETTSIEQGALSAIEDILYGTSTLAPRMPTIAEVISIFEDNALFIVVDNGDGTVTVTGPDDWVTEDLVDSHLWTLTSPSIFELETSEYKVSSY